MNNSGLIEICQGVCEPSSLSAVWLDLRTQSTVESLINKSPGKSKNHLKVSVGKKELWMVLPFDFLLIEYGPVSKQRL